MRSSSHSRVVPVRQIAIHDVSGSVGIDDDGFGLTLAINFHPRQGIPAGKFHPGRIAKHALGVDDIDQPARSDSPRSTPRMQPPGPDASLRALEDSAQTMRPQAITDRRCQNGVRAAEPVEQRNHGQAGQRAAAQIGAVKTRNAPRLARKDHRKQQSGQKEWQADAT